MISQYTPVSLFHFQSCSFRFPFLLPILSNLLFTISSPSLSHFKEIKPHLHQLPISAFKEMKLTQEHNDRILSPMVEKDARDLLSHIFTLQFSSQALHRVSDNINQGKKKRKRGRKRKVKSLEIWISNHFLQSPAFARSPDTLIASLHNHPITESIRSLILSLSFSLSSLTQIFVSLPRFIRRPFFFPSSSSSPFHILSVSFWRRSYL